MAIQINGTSGISGVDGSAATPALQGTDSNTGISFGTDTVSINTGGTAKATVDSSGRLGVGTTSPTFRLHSYDAAEAQALFSGWSSAGAFATAGAVRFGNTSSFQGRIDYDPNGNTNFIFENSYSSGAISWKINGGEKARIDSSGRLLVGTSSALGNFKWGGSGEFSTSVQFDGASSNRDVGLALINHSTSETSPVLRLAKSRGSAASPTAVVDGDYTGSIQFMGYDGSTYIDTARIDSVVDTTSGSNDMPGSLRFHTTSDSGNVVTERLRIDRVGTSSFRNTAYIHPGTDNASSCGVSTFRWSAIYAVNGTIQTSDKRQKTDINDSVLATDFIKALRPVSYKWIDGGNVDTGERDKDNNYIYKSVPGQRTHWGFIAQEVKEVVDKAGVDFGGWLLSDKDDPDSQQSLRYDQFIAPLTAALQEAIAKIESLEARLTTLEGGSN